MELVKLEQQEERLAALDEKQVRLASAAWEKEAMYEYGKHYTSSKLCRIGGEKDILRDFGVKSTMSHVVAGRLKFMQGFGG